MHFFATFVGISSNPALLLDSTSARVYSDIVTVFNNNDNYTYLYSAFL